MDLEALESQALESRCARSDPVRRREASLGCKWLLLQLHRPPTLSRHDRFDSGRELWTNDGNRRAGLRDLPRGFDTVSELGLAETAVAAGAVERCG